MRREAWERALDVQMDYHRWCSSDGGTLYNFGFFQSLLESAAFGSKYNDSASIMLSKLLVQTLWQGDTLYVTSDMMHVLMQAAADLPDDATFDEHTLITPCGFCLFEEPIMGIDGRGKTMCFNGIAWKKTVGQVDIEGEEDPRPAEPVLILYFLVDPHDSRDDYNAAFPDEMKRMGLGNPPLTLQHMYPTRFGETAPEKADVPGTYMVTETCRLFIAMQLLAQQRMGEPIQLRPNRAVRKRAAKWHEGDRYITLITLRRKSVKKDDAEPQKVDWSHRWLVQGHWRKQWYPKTKTHDYVYIFGYVKGPEDKPLVVRERRVFDFRR